VNHNLRTYLLSFDVYYLMNNTNEQAWVPLTHKFHEVSGADYGKEQSAIIGYYTLRLAGLHEGRDKVCGKV
jgi:hypothetical protein